MNALTFPGRTLLVSREQEFIGESAVRDVAVIIATRGRPEIVNDLVHSFSAQTVPPDHIFVIGSRPADIVGLEAPPSDVTALVGRLGSSFQRNDGLRLAADRFSYIAFFDDDFVPSRFWIERMAAFFSAHPDVAGLTGTLLADGISSAGIPLAGARAMVARRDADPAMSAAVHENTGHGGNIGCNMAFRYSAMKDIVFDERLPIYAWLEDADFLARVARVGRIVRSDALWGVHLGHKAGRGRGITLGYSQIANPAYLAVKGSVPIAHLAKSAIRNLLSNMVRSVLPESYVDRRGRLLGNLIALSDVVRGRITPERAALL